MFFSCLYCFADLRNYPTLDNVEKKRKMQDVREEGGGVLETAQFG